MIVQTKGWDDSEAVNKVAVYVWNTNTLSWQKSTAGVSGGATVSVDNFPATQPVSIASAVPVTDNGGSLTVDGTFWQATQPVSGTFWQATQPISAVSLPLPSGAATSANQSTEIASLASIDGKLPSLGQGAMAASVPVVLASNQSAVPVSGTFWQSTQPVSVATLPLPTDAATQTTLALIKAKTDNLDVTLSGGGAHVIVDSMPASSTGALVVDTDTAYTVASTQAITQTKGGRLRVESGGLVASTPQSYTTGDIKQLSLTTEGRLRVSTVDAYTAISFAPDFEGFSNNSRSTVISMGGF